ncbi:MAG: hypothetical protein ACQ9MH_14335 [Nitrospinales bacterium]
MTDSSDDRFLIGLEDKFGMAGYARWWKILEKIGKVYGETEDFSASFPLMYWQTYLKCKRNKLISFLDHLQNEGKMFYETNGNVLKISYPKFKEVKDSRHKKVPKFPPDVPPKIIDLELDIDKETHTNKDLMKKGVSTEDNLGTASSRKPSVCVNSFFSDWDIETALLFRNDMARDKPDILFAKSIESDAETIRFMREVDKRPKANIRSVWAKARTHEFWSTRIRGPDGLRKQFDGLEMQFARNTVSTESTSDTWLRTRSNEPQTYGAMNGET